MTFQNLYIAPAPVIGNDTEPEESYNINCNIPIPARLESDRVLLVPFIPSLHAKAYYDSWTPDLEKYLPLSTPTYQSFLDFIENILRRAPDVIPFAVIDKTKPAEPGSKIPGRLAGLFGYVHISPNNLSLEIGPAITLPAFQRTFVTSNAIALLLKYALDLPNEDGTGGLGFRRVVWCANPANTPSVTVAERMGFKKEGVMRYMWVLPEGQPGKAVDSRRGTRNGRDSVILSLCWDDWESGARELVEKQMNRT
ncbi:acyl-CoA N-acyltransferase [Panaeolus papilionaceus]|nr:acyl-CoA N-acyltransferase [Panaeolus papilionaceus]